MLILLKSSTALYQHSIFHTLMSHEERRRTEKCLYVRSTYLCILRTIYTEISLTCLLIKTLLRILYYLPEVGVSRPPPFVAFGHSTLITANPAERGEL